MIFNNNYTRVHVIDAIEGVYVGNANDAENNNEQGNQKRTSQKSYRNRQEFIEPRVSGATDKFVTTTQMAIQTGKSRQTIATRIRERQKRGVVKRNGLDKGGFWEILQ